MLPGLSCHRSLIDVIVTAVGRGEKRSRLLLDIWALKSCVPEIPFLQKLDGQNIKTNVSTWAFKPASRLKGSSFYNWYLIELCLCTWQGRQGLYTSLMHAVHHQQDDELNSSALDGSAVIPFSHHSSPPLSSFYSRQNMKRTFSGYKEYGTFSERIVNHSCQCSSWRITHYSYSNIHFELVQTTDRPKMMKTSINLPVFPRALKWTCTNFYTVLY